jgi:hypothetical protein
MPPSATQAVLLTLYRENSAQARHHDRQRHAITAMVALVAALALGLVGPDTRWLCAALLVGAGGFGFLASLHHHERARLHVERVHAVRRELSRLFEVDIAELYGAAAKVHARRYPRLSERTARVHWLWQAFHVGIVGLGSALALFGA